MREPEARRTYRRDLRKRCSGTIIILCIFLSLCAFITVFCMSFSVRVLSDEGKITLALSHRGGSDGESSVTGQDALDMADSIKDELTRTWGDGTKMVIESTGSKRELPIGQIYSQLIDSVVCVETYTGSATNSASGVIMSSNGYIITNEHVIRGAKSISVILSNKEKFTAALVGSDDVTDLAVLKIEKDDCTSAVFGNSDDLQVGDAVVAIGNPLGAMLSGTLTDGIISALNRDIEYNGFEMSLIQTNAALNSGSSGCPLINMHGQVIGIASMKTILTSESVEGIGFAIPVRTAKAIVDELIENGYIEGRPTFGFEVTDYELTPTAALYYGLPGGVVVSQLHEGSDAALKGVQAGDVIVKVNDREIDSSSALNSIRHACSIGDSVTLVLFRKGVYYQAQITVEENVY